MYDDHVSWAGYITTSITVDYLDISLFSKVISSSFNKFLFDNRWQRPSPSGPTISDKMAE